MNPLGRNQERATTDLSHAEQKTNLLLFASGFRMIECRFRATDRNLTIRLRNHENHKP